MDERACVICEKNIRIGDKFMSCAMIDDGSKKNQMKITRLCLPCWNRALAPYMRSKTI